MTDEGAWFTKTSNLQSRSDVAPMRRFERPTCRLGGGCSILLSYMGRCLAILNENRAAVKAARCVFFYSTGWLVSPGFSSSSGWARNSFILAKARAK